MTTTSTTYHCTCCHTNHLSPELGEWLYTEDGGPAGFGVCATCNYDICQCWVQYEVCTPAEIAENACQFADCSKALLF